MKLHKTQKTFLYILVLSLLIMPVASSAKSTWDYPRLANYFLDSYLHPDEGRLLAPWDVLILGAEAQEWQPDVFQAIREANPDVIILAYISITGVADSPTSADFPRFTELGNDQIPSEWWLKDSYNNRLGYWPGARMLNVTDLGPTDSRGLRWNDWLGDYVADNIYATGYWDGIFFDEAFAYVSWLNGGNLDLDGDGKKESAEEIDNAWQAGILKITKNLRERIGSNAYIVVNGASQYTAYTNGRMHESAFADGSKWSEEMNSYVNTYNASGYSPRLSLINSNTANTGVSNNQKMLFGFASTLLGDGFYSYDFGDQQHMNIWWQPEYDIKLGQPLGKAINLIGVNDQGFIPGLWRRDFDHGIVLVNSTNSKVGYELVLGDRYYSGSLEPYSGKVASINSLPLKEQASVVVPEPQPDIVEPPAPAQEPLVVPEPQPDIVEPPVQEEIDSGQPLFHDKPPVGGIVENQPLEEKHGDMIEVNITEISEPIISPAKPDLDNKIQAFIHNNAFLNKLKLVIVDIWQNVINFFSYIGNLTK